MSFFTRLRDAKWGNDFNLLTAQIDISCEPLSLSTKENYQLDKKHHQRRGMCNRYLINKLWYLVVNLNIRPCRNGHENISRIDRP